MSIVRALTGLLTVVAEEMPVPIVVSRATRDAVELTTVNSERALPPSGSPVTMVWMTTLLVVANQITTTLSGTVVFPVV